MRCVWDVYNVCGQAVESPPCLIAYRSNSFHAGWNFYRDNQVHILIYHFTSTGTQLFYNINVNLDYVV